MGDLPLEYIKGVYSETISTMSYSVNHRFLYLMAVINTLRYLHNYDPKFFDLTPDQQLCWFLFPSNFGGSPVLPYIRCLAKGDSDLETIWISLYVYLRKEYPDLFEIILGALARTLRPSTNYHSLATNCYSLPNRAPTGGFKTLQQHIRSCLPKIVQNKDFRAIILAADPGRTRDFISRLYSSKTIPAKAFSVLYETSAAGLLDEFVQKFSSARSMLIPLRKAYRGRAYQMIRSARTQDLKRLSWIRRTLGPDQSLTEDMNIRKYFELGENEKQCATQISELLRNYLWRKQIIGITYPCPVDQLRFMVPSHEELGLAGLMQDTFTLWIHPTTSNVNMCYTHGPQEMYLGMHTDLKVLPPPITVAGSSPGLERVEKILKVAPLLSKLGPTVLEYVSSNLHDISGLDGQVLLQCCWKYISGSISHRVPANHWSPIVGPNELPTRTSYVSHKTSTDRSLRSLHGDWTINFGSLLAFEMSTALYATEFNAWQDIPKQITHWIQLRKDCAHCLREIDDVPVDWSRYPKLLNMGISGNPYVGFTQEQRESLQHQINLKLQSIVEQLRINLDDMGSEGQYLAFKTIAHELLRETSKGTRGTGLLNPELNIPEDKLVAIKALQKIQTIGMTELKRMPSEILVEALYDYFTKFVFQRYPHCLRHHQEARLSDLKFTLFPFSGISQYIYDSGYWEVLKTELRRYLPNVSLALPKTSSDVHRRLVDFFNQKLQHDLSLRGDHLLTQRHSIYIVDFLTTEELQERHSDELQSIIWRTIREWCGTKEGSGFLHRLHNEPVNFMQTNFKLLIALDHLAPHLFASVLEIVEPGYQYPVFQVSSARGSLLQTFLHFGGLSPELITQVLERLQSREMDPTLTGEMMTVLTSTFPILMSARYTVAFVRLDQADTIVRESHHKEYSSLFTPPPVNPIMRISKSVLRRLKRHQASISQLITYRRDSAPVNELMSQNDSNAFMSILPERVSIPHQLCGSQALRLFGYSTSAPAKIHEIMSNVSGLDPRSEGSIICCGDLSGGFTRYMVQHFKGCDIVFNTLATDISEESLFVPDCEDLPLSDQRRIHFTNVQRNKSDLRDRDTIEVLKLEATQRFAGRSLLIIVCDVEIIEDGDENILITNNLMSLVSTIGDDSLLFIIKSTFRFPGPLQEQLRILRDIFVVVYLVKPYSSHDFSAECYIVAQYLHHPTAENKYAWPTYQTVIDLKEFKKIVVARRNTMKNGGVNLPWREYTVLAKDLIQKVGIMKLNQFEGMIGRALVQGVMKLLCRNDIQTTMVGITRFLYDQLTQTLGNLKDLLGRSRQVPSAVKRRRSEIPLEQIRHQSRLWLEYQLVLFFVLRVTDELSFQGFYENWRAHQIDAETHARTIVPDCFESRVEFNSHLQPSNLPDGDQGWLAGLSNRIMFSYRFLWYIYWSVQDV